MVSTPDSPVISNRQKNPNNTLSWSSSSSSTFSINSVSSLSSTSTPTTTITTATQPLMMMIRSTSRTLPLLMSDDDDDDDDADDDDDDGSNLLHQMEQDWHDDESQQQLHQQRWHRRVTKSLAYAASHGNSGLVQRILNDERLGPFLNVDDSDDKSMGTTPLIYASCFGYASIVQLLLDAGASVDVQDKIGWSPLMWATTNNHKAIVEILLAHGASWTNRTAKGRTVLDFVDYNNQELIQVLTPTPDQRPTQLDSQQQEFYKQMKLYRRRRQSSTLPKLVLDNDDDVYDYYDSTSTPKPERQTLVESIYTEDDDEMKELVSCEASMESLHHFVWHRCLPDQMFVFAEDDIEHILHVTISSLKLPMKTRQEIWVPSNVLFLCARYAHYYSARELLHGILSGAISKIANVLQNNKGDIHTLAFWMANLSQLLYYLKKDTGLVVATAEHQLEISELVSETYVLLVTDSEKRMDRILEPSMLDHDLIGADPVDFADDWQRFFRRRGSSRRPSSMAAMTTIEQPTSPINQRPQDFYQDEQHHSMDQPTSPMNSLSSFMSSTSVTSPSCTTLSPHSITSLLSSILYVLQSYEVHPTIIVQAIAQFFHFMSCELFNRILMNKKYMCRSKALQVRMNLSIIEDWVREQQPYLPIHLTSYFDPLIQLLQLLQCVSQLNDLTTFIGTLHGFELLNPLQIRRCVLNYRYEVDEPRLPDQVEKYTIQLAQHAVNNGNMGQQHFKKRSGVSSQSMEISLSRCSSNTNNNNNNNNKSCGSPINSTASSRRQSHVSSRPTSVSSLGSLIMARWTSTPTTPTVDNTRVKRDTTDELDSGDEDDQDLGDQQEQNINDGNDDDDDNDDQDDGRDWIEEKRDSNYMLPFSLPTSTTMIHYTSYQQHHPSPLQLHLHPHDDDDDGLLNQRQQKYNLPMSEAMYQELRQKMGATEREKRARERTVVPSIPQDWLDRLDRRQDACLFIGHDSDQGTRRAMEVS